MKNKYHKVEQFFVPKNRRGWIRVLEVFIALLMITSVSLVAINREYKSKSDVSANVLEIENSILRNIQIDDNIRKYILELNAANLPLELEKFPDNLKTKIESGVPSYLECDAKICAIRGACEIVTASEKDAYIQSVVITANRDNFDPTILKLGCWRK